MSIIGLYPLADRARDIHQQVATFIETHVRPGQAEYSAELTRSADRWTVPAVIDGLKAKARQEGLWNLFLTDAELGAGLRNLEYAPIAELTGHEPIPAEGFNCSAPETGNMERLQLYGT